MRKTSIYSPTKYVLEKVKQIKSETKIKNLERKMSEIKIWTEHDRGNFLHINNFSQTLTLIELDNCCFFEKM